MPVPENISESPRAHARGLVSQLRFMALGIALVAFLARPGAAAESSGPEDEPADGPAAAAPPPAAVSVATIESGALAPDGEFIGTVYFKEVSTVAAETAGKVEDLYFEPGQRVERDDVLIHLDSEILESTIAGLKAAYEGALVELEQARADLAREERLFRDKAGAERVYDDARFRVGVLENRVAAAKAALERAQIELRKTNIAAPFAGVVLEKLTEVGEWVGAGGAVAVIANERVMDVVIDAPGSILPHLKMGASAPVTVGGEPRQGAVFTVIPRGDIATRTFPVKIRLENQAGLFEGMDARVRLPVGPERACLIAPRDAVINFMGQDTLFLISPDSTAVPQPVTVIGFQGLHVGVEGDGLGEGMQVVIKGQERLRPGQTVAIMPPAGGESADSQKADGM